MTVDAEAPMMLGRLARVFELGHLSRLWLPLTLMGLRGFAIVSKFLLALYTTRYLGLADLGIYGLVVGATLVMPAMFGFGLNDWMLHYLVRQPRAEFVARAITRLAFTVCVQLIVQPIGLAINAALGSPIPLSLALPIAIILLLEHLARDSFDVLIARGRALLANLCGFFRVGFWPPVAIVVGLIDPRAQTMGWVFCAWASGLVLMWVMLGVQLSRHGRWRHIGLRVPWIMQGLRESLHYYVKDISNVISLTADRFLVSIFLGLELTGVYTFFWSMANVMQGLVVFGTVQPHIPALVEAKVRSRVEFHALERRLIVETLAWTVLVAAAICIVTPFLLPFMQRPLLEANLLVFWLIVAATIVRIGSDSYTFVLVALQLDRVTAVISIAGAISSAVLNALLLPLAGLYGAAFTYLASASGLLVARFIVSRARPEMVEAAKTS
jgi:O-antigen/teichoic acid export membrane protein